MAYAAFELGITSHIWNMFQIRRHGEARCVLSVKYDAAYSLKAKQCLEWNRMVMMALYLCGAKHCRKWDSEVNKAAWIDSTLYSTLYPYMTLWCAVTQFVFCLWKGWRKAACFSFGGVWASVAQMLFGSTAEDPSRVSTCRIIAEGLFFLMPVLLPSLLSWICLRKGSSFSGGKCRQILERFCIPAYYPNYSDKGWYPKHSDYCIGADCNQRHLRPDGQTPTDATCWAYSFYWHLQKARDAYGSNSVMVQVVEDDRLGDGQRLESQMAQNLGLRILRVDWSSLLSTSENERHMFDALHADGMIKDKTD